MAEVRTFDTLGLDPDILSAITELGFEIPTAVQVAVIPKLLKRKGDLVGLAQTGTGKTAAFGLPIIQQLDMKSSDTQALVLCPTRELCMQIAKDLKAFSKHKKGLHVLAVYGGSSIDTQIRALNRGVHVIVATPGRINDLLRRGKANLTNVNRVVLDEADEMLNMGFQEDLETILKQVPDSAHTLLFSATMPRQVATIAGNYMKDAEEITVGTKNAGAENVEHVCYTVQAKDRYLALKRLADFYPSMYGIVFCRTRRETQEVADKLMKDGYSADSLHGDLSQAQRDRVMNNFRTRNIQMLVATDVAARGLDVTDLTHIINYNLPDDLESYTHRSGRTGRAGKTGVSVAIVHLREKGRIHRIEKLINKKFEFKKIPSGKEVCASQLIGLIERVKNVEVSHDSIDRYLPEIESMLEGMSREDLIKHFVSLEFNRFLNYYRGAPDLNVVERKQSRERRERRETGAGTRGGGFTKLFMNVGKKDGISPKELMGMINDVMPGKPIDFGKIDITKTSTFFEVSAKEADRVVQTLSDFDYDDRPIRIEQAGESTTRSRAPGHAYKRGHRPNQKKRNRGGKTRR